MLGQYEHPVYSEQLSWSLSHPPTTNTVVTPIAVALMSDSATGIDATSSHVAAPIPNTTHIVTDRSILPLSLSLSLSEAF
mmetsp:Transcript_5592/g.16911  ORF Transcript_5592/g.16911 Transcript_5592/m.16911 type:complete len:80 (-) Transcript_5592:133-372(-)